jgi:hypothetical protein
VNNETGTGSNFWLHSIWHPLHHAGYQFWSGIGSDLGELTLITTMVALFATVYRHLECHKTGCHRLGRFQHGHWRLCRIHHPHIPTSGAITQEHVNDGGHK